MPRVLVLKEVEVALVVLVFPNVWSADQVLESARSVEDAAVTVMLPVPSNETPLIVRAFWSAVAVPALPETEPGMVCVKVFAPENLLASARSVDEAAVIV